jgi:hypothetical protein
MYGKTGGVILIFYSIVPLYAGGVPAATNERRFSLIVLIRSMNCIHSFRFARRLLGKGFAPLRRADDATGNETGHRPAVVTPNGEAFFPD